MTLSTVHHVAGDTEPLTVWTHKLPHGLAGLKEDEPRSCTREERGFVVPCRTSIKVWPVLACCQGDTPFIAAASQTCHHSGHHACWRCGMVSQRELDNEGDEQRKQRWLGYAEPVQIPAICLSNPDYTGPQLNARGNISIPVKPHARLPGSSYCLPAGYCAADPEHRFPLRWQYRRADDAPMQVCTSIRLVAY